MSLMLQIHEASPPLAYISAHSISTIVLTTQCCSHNCLLANTSPPLSTDLTWNKIYKHTSIHVVPFIQPCWPTLVHLSRRLFSHSISPQASHCMPCFIAIQTNMVTNVSPLLFKLLCHFFKHNSLGVEVHFLTLRQHTWLERMWVSSDNTNNSAIFSHTRSYRNKLRKTHGNAW